MQQSTAQRRLVKSPPELWAEVSSTDALGRHLAPFGEIRITRTQPETTVAWEGDRASGTVELEPAGWGTTVILTAKPAPAPAHEAAAAVVVVPPTAPVPESASQPLRSTLPPHDASAAPAAPGEPRRGFFARLFGRNAQVTPQLSPPAPGPEPSPPEPDPAPTLAAPEPQPGRTSDEPPLDTARTEAILADVLDDLGAAHHRPFSRD